VCVCPFCRILHLFIEITCDYSRGMGGFREISNSLRKLESSVNEVMIFAIVTANINVHIFSFPYFYFNSMLINSINRVCIRLSIRYPPITQSFKSLLFVPLYPFYSHVSPDNFRDSKRAGEGEIKLPKVKENGECEG